MLRIVNQHYKNLHAELVAGVFGTKLEDLSRVTRGGGFFGVSSKLIRNLYVLSANLIDKGEINLKWALDERVFRDFLTMLGVSEADAKQYKYVSDHTAVDTVVTIRFGIEKDRHVEAIVEVKNIMIDDQKIVVPMNTPVVGVQLLDTRRRRFDLMLDNPLHVAYGMIEARKKAEKVVVSLNSPGYPVRARESETLHLSSMELFNAVAFYSAAGGGTNRNFLGKGHSVEAHYATNRTIMDAMHGSSPTLTTFIYDFTDIEEFKCSSLLRDKLHLDYSLFPMGRQHSTENRSDTKVEQRYELSKRTSLLMHKALREKAAEHQKDAEMPRLFDYNRVVTVESLHDVIELEKSFHLPNTAISKKEVIGSLRQYYADVGGIAMALVRSENRRIVQNKEICSFSLVDLRNGVETIRCDATVMTFDNVNGVYEVEPITYAQPMAFNSIDVKIFSDRIHALLKKGCTIAIRKKDGSKFSLHPMLFDQLPYVGNLFDDTDERIRSQMVACFTDVTEVELKPKQGSNVRGYKFIAEPHR